MGNRLEKIGACKIIYRSHRLDLFLFLNFRGEDVPLTPDALELIDRESRKRRRAGDGGGAIEANRNNGMLVMGPDGTMIRVYGHEDVPLEPDAIELLDRYG